MTYKKILFSALALTFGQIALAQDQVKQTDTTTDNSEPFESRILLRDKPAELKKINLNFLLRSSLEVPLKGDDQSSIKMNEARFEVLGNLTSDLDFRIRYRLNRSQAPRSQDNSAGSIDHANVTYKFGKGRKWSITAGKQAAYIGSWEFETNPTYEYQYSEFVNRQANLFLMALRLNYKINENHSVHLQVHNTWNDNFNTLIANTGYKPDGLKGSKIPMGVYASWLGKLLDKKLHTFWSYNISEYAKGEVNHSVAIGNKLVLKKWNAYLDLQTQSLAVDYVNIASPSINKYQTSLNPAFQPAFARDVNYKSAVLRVDYQFVPGWFITAKGIYEAASQTKGTNKAGNNFRENIGYLGGLEYKPVSHQNFKIFGYYYNNEQRYRNNISAVNGNTRNDMFAVGVLYFVNAL